MTNIGFEYRQVKRGEVGVPVARVYDVDTGKDIEMVQAVYFRLSAGDMLPYLQLDVIPAEVKIMCEGYTDQEIKEMCQPTPPTGDQYAAEDNRSVEAPDNQDTTGGCAGP